MRSSAEPSSTAICSRDRGQGAVGALELIGGIEIGADSLLR